MAADLLQGVIDSLVGATKVLIYPALFFFVISLVFRRGEVLAAGRRALRETGTNLSLYFIDVLFVVPPLAILVVLIGGGVEFLHLTIVGPETWADINAYVVLVLAVFLGDFIGYWRHRLEHVRVLWPAHAVHHSDTRMTWLTLSRFHPVNRFTTVGVDTVFLVICGIPEWALVANLLVRHYYGYFIHADIPWTYGPFSRVFVSPVMHRWHHVKDVEISGKNFATVFSVFDRAFGTYYMPGLCRAPLGVMEDMGNGVQGQLAYPFVTWRRDIKTVFERTFTTRA